MLEIEEAFNILEEEYKKQKTLLNKIHTIKEYLFDLEADLEEEKAENNEKAEIIKKALDYINEMCLCSYGYANYGDDLNPEHIIDILRGKDKLEYLGYSDKECINCGRLRVEKYSDGTEICEKCNFDQNKKEYVLRG